MQTQNTEQQRRKPRCSQEITDFANEGENFHRDSQLSALPRASPLVPTSSEKCDSLRILGNACLSPSAETRNRLNILPLKLPPICKVDARDSVTSSQMGTVPAGACKRFSLNERDESDSEDSFNKLLEIASEEQDCGATDAVLPAFSSAKNSSDIHVRTTNLSEETRDELGQSNRKCGNTGMSSDKESVEMGANSSEVSKSSPYEGSRELSFAPFFGVASTKFGPTIADCGSKREPILPPCETKNTSPELAPLGSSMCPMPSHEANSAMNHIRFGERDFPSVQVNDALAKKVPENISENGKSFAARSLSNFAGVRNCFREKALLHTPVAKPLEGQGIEPLITFSRRECIPGGTDGRPMDGFCNDRISTDKRKAAAEETKASLIQRKGCSKGFLNFEVHSANGRKSILGKNSVEIYNHPSSSDKADPGFVSSSESAVIRDGSLSRVPKEKSLTVATLSDLHNGRYQSKPPRVSPIDPLDDSALADAIMEDNKRSSVFQSYDVSGKYQNSSLQHTTDRTASDFTAKDRASKKRAVFQPDVEQSHPSIGTNKCHRKRQVESRTPSHERTVKLGNQIQKIGVGKSSFDPSKSDTSENGASCLEGMFTSSFDPHRHNSRPLCHTQNQKMLQSRMVKDSREILLDQTGLTKQPNSKRFKRSHREESNIRFTPVSPENPHGSNSWLEYNQAVPICQTKGKYNDTLQVSGVSDLFLQSEAIGSEQEQKHIGELFSEGKCSDRSGLKLEVLQHDTKELLDHKSGTTLSGGFLQSPVKVISLSPPSCGLSDAAAAVKRGPSSTSESIGGLPVKCRAISFEKEYRGNAASSRHLDFRRTQDQDLTHKHFPVQADIGTSGLISGQIVVKGGFSSRCNPEASEVLFSSPPNAFRDFVKSKNSHNRLGEIIAKDLISVVLENVISGWMNRAKKPILLRLPLLPSKRVRNGSDLVTNEAKRKCLSSSAPCESARFKVHVWDLIHKKRSPECMLLSRAINICEKSTNFTKFIYDGEDFDFENPQVLDVCPTLAKERSNFLKRDAQSFSLRKIRIWDSKEQDLVRFHDSPSLSNIEAYLSFHPSYTVFQPIHVYEKVERLRVHLSGLTNYSRASGVILPGASSSKSPSRIGALFRKVLLKIRELRVTELPDAPQQVRLWNAAISEKTVVMPFPSRADLTRYLLQHPNLEVDLGQDVLHSLKASKGLYLIPVYCNCPVEFSCLWDKVNKKVCVNPKFYLEENKATIGDYIRNSSRYEVYDGQDLNEVQLIRRCIDQYSRGGQFPYVYMLSFCPELVRLAVYDKQWTPSYVDSVNRRCSSAVFWNRCSRSVEPKITENLEYSIQAYLEEHSDTVEPYVGQDLSEDVQAALTQWFQVLRFKPGFADPNKIAFLLRSSSGNESKVGALKSLPTNKKRKLQKNHLQSGSKKLPSKRVKSATNTRSINSCEVEELLNGNGRDNNTVSVSFQGIEDGNEQKTIDFENSNCDQRQPPSSFKVFFSENRDFDKIEDVGAIRVSNKTNDHEGGEVNKAPTATNSLFEEVVRLDDLACTRNSVFPNRQNVAGKSVINAKKKITEMVEIIKEAGPKILRRELAVDLRQTLRERLILEIKCGKKLREFAWNVENVGIGELAVCLLEKLLVLDVYSMFSKEIEPDLGPPSLSVLKAEVGCGEVCTIGGVATRFREICMDLFSFHEESAMQNEVAAILQAGEELINRFTAEHKYVMAHETKMVRIHSICLKGAKIGFKKDCGRCRTNISEKLKVSEKGSLHVSGTQPQVTYMNYRDEKGHSVMGKQQSVRVMGMSIDLHECERRIGQIHKCHLCRRQVRESTGELLKCSNTSFGFCNEVVCQGCVEKELDIDFNEFNRIRTNERWFCVHCCGHCPQGSICSNELFGKKQWDSERDVTLWWTGDSNIKREVTLFITRRALDGEYREEYGREVKLTKDRHSRRWSRNLTLKLGAYRCRIVIDGSWVASTTFQVFPVNSSNTNRQTTKKRPCATPLKEHSVEGQDNDSDVDEDGKPLIGKKWVEKNRKKMGPQRIEWEMSRNSQIGSSDVRTRRSHSFGSGDGGKLIKNCSRTEGFDWRHAKHYPIVQWIPQQVGETPNGEMEDHSNDDTRNDITYCPNDWMSKTSSKRCRPLVSIGTCQRQFSIDWNSMMYEKMRKLEHGIVTGRSEIHGIGLFTLTGYERGDMVIEYAGSVIRTPLGDVREKEYQAAGLGTYLFKLNEEQIVDATVRSNRARFTNHSCDPNMIADVITIHGRELVVLRAIRRIPKYSELTFDYKLPYEEDEKLPCLCDSSYCAGVMN